MKIVRELPNAEALVEALLGAAALTRRGRELAESLAAGPRTEPPCPDEALIELLLGVVAMSRALDVTLDELAPLPVAAPVNAPRPATAEDLLR